MPVYTMDTLTHIALGACIGDALLDKRIGRKAMLWGAVAQSIPDIDFVNSFWMPVTDGLLAHRGLTHSFLFCGLVSLLFAWLCSRQYKRYKVSLKQWILFFLLEMLVHIFLDAFNNYGTGWFEPFNHARISFNAIYVADPFFSIWPGIATLALAFKRSRYVTRRYWQAIGIGVCTIYLAYCCVNKWKVENALKETAALHHLPHTRYFTTPTPFNSWLWYVVTGDDNGYYVGFRSVFDKGEGIAFRYYPRNTHLLQPATGSRDLENLLRFSQGFYTAEKWNDTLVFNDLRFGQIQGWVHPEEKFVFHYFLQGAKDNLLVVQRGRFTGWNREALRSFIRRIKGV